MVFLISILGYGSLESSGVDWVLQITTISEEWKETGAIDQNTLAKLNTRFLRDSYSDINTFNNLREHGLHLWCPHLKSYFDSTSDIKFIVALACEIKEDLRPSISQSAWILLGELVLREAFEEAEFFNVLDVQENTCSVAIMITLGTLSNNGYTQATERLIQLVDTFLPNRLHCAEIAARELSLVAFRDYHEGALNALERFNDVYRNTNSKPIP